MFVFLTQAQKRASTSGSQENNSRHSYANNFGAGFGKTGGKDAESLVISSSFKAVVSRLVVVRKDLKSQENMVREQYIKIINNNLLHILPIFSEYFILTFKHVYLFIFNFQALYRSIRQFMTYVREYHGGVFRRVALSGLLDSAERPHKKNKNTIQTTRIVR